MTARVVAPDLRAFTKIWIYLYMIHFITNIYKNQLSEALSHIFLPFAKNWIVEGNIVRDGIVRLFDFKKLIGISNYIVED